MFRLVTRCQPADTGQTSCYILQPLRRAVVPCWYDAGLPCVRPLQIALVYPLDTVKVRCQAAGIGSRQVVEGLWAATKGNWSAFLAALYAGALPAAALSIVVGSVHYCCFCATRRAVASLTGADKSSSSGQQAAAAAAADAAGHQHVIVSHGATGTHFIPFDDTASLCDLDEEQQQQQQLDSQQQQAGGSSSSRSQGRQAAAAAVGDASEEAESVQVAKGSLVVNCVAAVITAAITALVESPLELFRHNSQAGHIQGNFIREMWRVSRR